MIYITGDTHGSFGRIRDFCERFETSRDDIMIILGDAGINFSGPAYDIKRKNEAGALPITLFCVHGNHERRPSTIESYEEKMWRGGKVYVEADYPTILFAKDGEIYDLNGMQTIVIGGAYSIDKRLRLLYGYPWFEDEQPSEEIKRFVERQLDARDWKIDVVLSHTTPLKYEPLEVFDPDFDPKRTDQSTEIWLDAIEDRLTYRKWYCGHFHTEKKIDRLEIMYENYDIFPEQSDQSEI